MASDVQSVFQKEARKQEQQAKAGILTNIPALGGLACDRENARRRGCGGLLWDTEDRVACGGCSFLVGGLQFQLSWT